MYLVISKDPMGQIRRAIALTLAMASDLAAKMRTNNPDGIVVIERPDGATILGRDDAPAFPFEETIERCAFA
jgi:hypothetical protein